MITATQALDLVQASEKDIERRLNKISEAITRFATDGKRELDLVDADPYDTLYRVERNGYNRELNKVQKTLSARLSALGFRVSVVTRKSSGRGLGCIQDEDTPLPETEYIVIAW